MKDFCEVMDIKDKLKLNVSLILVPVESCQCKVTINGCTLYDNVMSTQVNLAYQIGLNDSISVEITIQRKHPEAIIINDLSVDGNSIIPLYRDYAVPATNYLHETGTWKLEIPNFYQWYHQITGQGWIA